MNATELESLRTFLRKEFAMLNSPQESNWVLKELEGLSSCEAHERAETIVSRRKKGEPLAYILGHWDFRKLKLSVGPGVLIPRPETEELVQIVLEYMERSAKKSFRVADLGAGSGAIAYSLVSEAKKEIEVIAVEKSHDAFFYLKKNLPAAFSKKIQLLNQDWEAANLSDVDIIVSNPPYVSLFEMQNLDSSVKDYEPREALLAGEHLGASAAYESLIRIAKRSLNPGGALFFEFGPAQDGIWDKLIPPNFQWKTYKDLSGKERILSAFDLSSKNR